MRPSGVPHYELSDKERAKIFRENSWGFEAGWEDICPWNSFPSFVETENSCFLSFFSLLLPWQLFIFPPSPSDQIFIFLLIFFFSPVLFWGLLDNWSQRITKTTTQDQNRTSDWSALLVWDWYQVICINSKGSYLHVSFKLFLSLPLVFEIDSIVATTHSKQFKIDGQMDRRLWVISSKRGKHLEGSPDL